MLIARRTVSAAIALLSASLAHAQPGGGTPAPDKNGYWLFNPTPRDLMRQMSTDRPDTTESPFTLDAGHVQVELSFVDFTYGRGNGTNTRTLAVAPMLVKFGLTNSIDLQIGIDPYTQERAEVRATGVTERFSGFGDTTVRLKVNVFGNDSTEATGGWALAVMPFVTFPTAREGLGADKVEGGIIVPAAVDLCEGWSLGLMAELDFVSSADGDGNALDFLHTATIACDLSDRVGAFIEYAGYLSLSDEEDYRAYFNTGMTYALTADVQLDCGVRIGLTGPADDLGVFTGVSLRW
ncbi:MAG: transporter [Phycisphaerales bacterium]|nr:transporter [Phycisphaerales bacterium]